MKRLNVMISDKAKAVVIDYQKTNGITNQDDATDELLLIIRTALADREKVLMEDVPR